MGHFSVENLMDLGLEVIERTSNEELGNECLHLHFIDEGKAKEQDAFAFILSPGGRSPIYKITDEHVTVVDELKSGKALLIRYLPGRRKVENISFDKPGMTIVHPYGSIFCWAARDENIPTMIFGTNSPPYREGQEEEYTIDDKRVPAQLRKAIEATLK
jgi:hypothetical protein